MSHQFFTSFVVFDEKRIITSQTFETQGHDQLVQLCDLVVLLVLILRPRYLVTCYLLEIHNCFVPFDTQDLTF